jgi:Leucine-rich repeat (LRR) protein
MSNFKILNFIIVVCMIKFTNATIAQSTEGNLPENKEYNSIEEALNSPSKVFRLNLSNAKINILPDSIWNRFQNLEYLSLKNDHLKEIPAGIGYLKNLKTLDLSGNDFKVLPKTFAQLSNLNEIYLNDEVNMDIDETIDVLKDLPNLKILHLENDKLKKLPTSILHLKNLESLYINNNHFKKVPLELRDHRKLKFVDLHDNKYNINLKGIDNQSFGYTMRF